MGPKKKKKRLRGAFPGSSKFARVSAHAIAGKSKPAPFIGVSSGDVSPPAPLEADLASAPPLPGTPSPDLASPAVVINASPTDPKSDSVDSSSFAVAGSSSGEKGSYVPVTPAPVAADQKLDLSHNIVVGSTSNVVTPTVSIHTNTVAGSPSGAVSPPRKYSTVARDSSCLEEIGSPTQHISGVPFVFIPDENIQAAKAEFKDFIFAQFHGPPPAMGRVIGVVNAIWAKTGPRIFVHRIGEGTYLLKATVDRVRDNILSRNMWNIVGHPMFVAPWSPDFNPDTPPLSSAVVTVELRGVPYLLFNKESLGRIATAIGKPVALAPETERKENFEVARILIRVNLLKELPTRVVSGFSNGREIEIDVSYPWLPPKCSVCANFGHLANRCTRTTTSTSGRKVAARSSSRRGRPSRRERLSSRSSHSRVGRSKTVASSRVLISPEPSKLETASAGQLEGNPSPVLETGRDSKSQAIPTEPVMPADPSCSIEDKEVEAPFFLVTRRKSGRKAASLL